MRFLSSAFSWRSSLLWLLLQYDSSGALVGNRCAHRKCKREQVATLSSPPFLNIDCPQSYCNQVFCPACIYFSGFLFLALFGHSLHLHIFIRVYGIVVMRAQIYLLYPRSTGFNSHIVCSGHAHPAFSDFWFMLIHCRARGALYSVHIFVLGPYAASIIFPGPHHMTFRCSIRKCPAIAIYLPLS